jgi:hypothetical protein
MSNGKLKKPRKDKIKKSEMRCQMIIWFNSLLISNMLFNKKRRDTTRRTKWWTSKKTTTWFKPLATLVLDSSLTINTPFNNKKIRKIDKWEMRMKRTTWFKPQATLALDSSPMNNMLSNTKRHYSRKQTIWMISKMRTIWFNFKHNGLNFQIATLLLMLLDLLSLTSTLILLSQTIKNPQPMDHQPLANQEFQHSPQ